MNVRGPLGPILLNSDFAFLVNHCRAARLVLRELKGSLLDHDGGRTRMVMPRTTSNGAVGNGGFSHEPLANTSWTAH